MERSHAPQDHIYGPLHIPHYCWQIIDTVEFQRLRHLAQLGAVSWVYPGANHTRFEHSLGCCHLAVLFLERIQRNQPEIVLTEEQIKSVIIAALCHDLGRGPFHEAFDLFVAEIDSSWNPHDMAGEILRHIVSKYNLDISNVIVDAACKFICGATYLDWPSWLSQIVSNRESDIDIDKADYLCRDMNRTINSSRFEYNRLIVNCRVIEGKLSWKLSEIPTLERFFFNSNDMNVRVYKHRVVESIILMLKDIFMLMNDSGELNFEEILSDPQEFCTIDDRVIYRVEWGQFGEEAQKLIEDIQNRRLYKLVEEIRFRPSDIEGMSYSQRLPSMIENDISLGGERCNMSALKVVSTQFRYGLGKDTHPMLSVPFWKEGSNKPITLSKDDISCISPHFFNEATMRIYCTDSNQLEDVKMAFQAWKKNKFMMP